MEILRIRGGRPLYGEARMHGAKNSVLPILAAAILSGESVIHNCPRLSDVDAARKILEYLGCRTSRQGDTVTVNASSLCRNEVPDCLMREMRSSVIFLGAVLARTGEARISLPGGCELGPRPVDMHLAAMKALGAEIEEKDGGIICRASKLTGGRINFPFPSVGATENAMLAASGAQGITMIYNAAAEPEISDLQEFLRKEGVKITGAGTPVIMVEGAGERINPEHRVISDRIETVTYMAAAASAGGEILLRDVVPGHFTAVTETFRQMGCEISAGAGEIRIKAGRRVKAPDLITTRPYPGFPTDAQPPVMAACLRCRGTAVFIENIFQNRYRHIGELLRMGADIKTEGRTAIVAGKREIHPAAVEATDLRGGAALAVAALAAEGETTITGVNHISRGYEDIEGTLRSLGADAEAE